ncbi:MAG: hypothetical protein OES24_16935 [Acidimicrobiia bacterium]|nr:hypothetical protein [Acidimicrobiia bacterium]
MAAVTLYGWVNGTLAAGVARLDQRLDFDATTLAAHLATFAIGLIVAGTGRLDRLSRYQQLAPLIFAATLIPFVTAPHAFVSLASAAVLGASGSITLANAQATITADSETDGNRVLVTANVFAALTAVASATLVGAVPLGLVGVTTVPAVAAAVWIVHRGSDGRSMHVAPRRRAGPPNRREGIGLVLVGLVVAIEFSIGNQIASYFNATGAGVVGEYGAAILFVGLSGGRIATALSLPRAGAAGRWILTAALVALTMALASVQLADPVPLRVIALAAAGVALGPLYPLAIALTLDSARDRNTTSSHTTAAIGTALIVTPLSVGGISDSVSSQAGFAIITTLAVVATTTSMLAGRSTPESPGPHLLDR